METIRCRDDHSPNVTATSSSKVPIITQDEKLAPVSHIFTANLRPKKAPNRLQKVEKIPINKTPKDVLGGYKKQRQFDLSVYCAIFVSFTSTTLPSYKRELLHNVHVVL
ncbi:hypothetical protein LOAG_05967 [Loa loa]|uniref:Uncharacterized protein n=1 Tax=Loa loa TaxID=7209 RepID=A0A1S0TYW2_LOALO|nr:hypothetical protein LOAG_05967 [Loa loa]EFO22520.1 hypothetical protein LOAG_05967 [Loa loa]